VTVWLEPTRAPSRTPFKNSTVERNPRRWLFSAAWATMHHIMNEC
jgi:hypothetical protein